MGSFPKITFGIIVLNGEPFTRYCLRALYPFAYEIIVVEGACKAAAAIAAPGTHSTDGTLEVLRRFKVEEDPEDKLRIVTRDGFWSEKDEQSQAYAERARGDYLWQVDIDEFYQPADMRAILHMLRQDPGINGVSFQWKNFWGGFDYLVDGWEYRILVKRIGGIRRVFRWGAGYCYASHRPPTVLDQEGRDMYSMRWLDAGATARLGIFCYHYGMLFPKQAREKMLYYPNALPGCQDMPVWYRDCYLQLRHPFRVLHATRPPSWLSRFCGVHPPEISKLIADCRRGLLNVGERGTGDIEKLLRSRLYRVTTGLFSYLAPPIMGLAGPLGWLFRTSKSLLRLNA